MIYHRDMFDVLPMFDAETVDACVTDPPYDLTSNKRGGSGDASLNLNSPAGRSRVSTGGGFMGKKWDSEGVAFNVATWCRVLRVLKPGAYLLAFGGTRTFHRMTCAIEDAGFEIRDCLSWLYGQGFPKSLDVAQAIDRAAGQTRGRVPHPRGKGFGERANTYAHDKWTTENAGTRSDKEPLTEAAEAWQGWGTALKPGWEPIIFARKPLIGTVAANVLRHGTGALNIDACRIETSGEPIPQFTTTASRKFSGRADDHRVTSDGIRPDDLGRWPANVCLDEEAAVMLDEQTGESESTGGLNPIKTGITLGTFEEKEQRGFFNYGDLGGASRFYYVAKPSREERNYGLDNPGPQFTHGATLRKIENTQPHGNFHPTVKPVELMRWLVKLVTPPGGVVLDPFMGSGTTGMACRYEHREFIGIEREAEYVEIAERRIAAVAPLFNQEARG